MRDGSPAFSMLSDIFCLYEPLSGVPSDRERGGKSCVVLLVLESRSGECWATLKRGK